MLLALLFSGVLHALLLALLQPSLESETYQLPAQPAYPDSIQARFPRFHYIPIGLIETPDIVKEKTTKEPTPFLSDKNAEAADRYSKNDLPKGLPYSEGNAGLLVFQGGDGMPPGRSFPSPPSAAGGGQRSGEHDPQLPDAGSGSAGKPYEGDGLIPWERLRKQSEGASAQGPAPASQIYQPFSRDLLHGGGRGGSRAYSNDGQFNNRKSSAPEFGDVTLSTYAWEWAPYIEYMRRRLRAHIYPPPAFYVMGAISGEVRLHFKLLRNGTVEGLETLGYQGHASFVQTSINAVRASNPFKPLPADFPDEVLEMTWIFCYYLR